VELNCGMIRDDMIVEELRLGQRRRGRTVLWEDSQAKYRITVFRVRLGLRRWVARNLGLMV